MSPALRVLLPVLTVPLIAPTIPTNSARLMVRAADNVFFDINNGVITILNNNTPSIELSDESIELTLPVDSLATLDFGVTINGEIGSVLSYEAYPGSDFQFNIGAEINYKSNLQIRLGRNNNGFLSTGIGLVWTNFSIDYAYSPSPSYTGFGSSQLISFRIDPVWFKTKIVSFL